MAKSRSKIPHVSLYKNGKSGRWEIAYTVNGKRRIERLGMVEAHARQRAQEVSNLMDKKASKLITPVELNRLVKDRVPLERHLANYIAHQEAMESTPRYVATLKKRIETVIEFVGARKLDHLTGPAIEKALPLIRAIDGKNDRKLAPETVRHYLKAVRRFLNWCSRQGLVLHNPMNQVQMPTKGEVRHKRRIPDSAEIKYLLAWLDKQPSRRTTKDTSGADRAMFYRVLSSTGYRMSEALAITTAMICFDAPARITLPGHLTKNEKEAVQPLPAWLATSLKAWIGERTGKVFLRFGSIGKTFERDLLNARTAWINDVDESLSDEARKAVVIEHERSNFLKRRVEEQGVWDLHSFRHYYVTSLVRSGITVKDAQTLARHSSPELTIGTYSHASGNLATMIESAIEEV